MKTAFILVIDLWYFWVPVAAIVSYFTFRFVQGRSKIKQLLFQMEGEGLLRYKKWRLIRVNFPLIHRITFSDIYLTKNRLVLINSFTKNKMLQAPVGPKGKAGKDNNIFKVEKASMLTFTTPINGGGRIRMHLKNALDWFNDIVEN